MIPPSTCQPWQTDRSGPMPESTVPRRATPRPGTRSLLAAGDTPHGNADGPMRATSAQIEMSRLSSFASATFALDLPLKVVFTHAGVMLRGIGRQQTQSRPLHIFGK